MANNTLMQKLIPHIGAFLMFLIVPVIYFLPQLQGKVVQSGDLISYKAMAKELIDFEEATGERSSWTNSMFGGMPAYQIESGQPSNMLRKLEKLGQLYIFRPIGYFFAMCIAFYILMLYLGAGPWVSIICALCFSFSTGNLILFEAGHMTKLRVIAYFGFVVMGMIMAFRKEYLHGGIIFAVGLGLNLLANHVQMTYYLFLALGIFVLIEIVNKVKAGEVASLTKTLLVLLLAGSLGVLSSTSRLWTTYEYSKDTMRGDPILTSNGAGPKSSSETKGLDWEYAMQWSNGTLDLVSSFIPGVMGGGSQEELGSNSALYKDLRSKGANVGKDFKAPLYWGDLPFTSGPFYFGAVICFLFILGLTLLKGPLKWWLGISVLFLMLLSLGKNFSILNRLIFDYIPLFNKFRTPNSVLTIVGFLVPILSGLVLSDILGGKIAKEKAIQGLKIALGITGGICLFFGLVGPSFFDFSAPGDGRLEQAGYSIPALLEDRQSLMRSDAFRSLALVVLTAAALWAFLQQKIKSTLVLGVIGLLAIGDLWMVNKRYVDEADFVEKSKSRSKFVPRAVDNEILKDTDPNFRVLDLSINTFSAASSSYYHKTIGGYHAAKLQRYQDLIDRHLTQGNQGVLAMLNTKYVITQDQQVQRFPGAAGNAWTVKEIQEVASANEEIDALKNFNPLEKAIVHNEFSGYVKTLSPKGEGTVQLTNYQPNHLTYESNAASEELAVFSEIWYGPNKGWDAYLDGQLVDHIRVNYALRALKIPTGKHKIEFKFEPRSYALGKTITLIFSTILLLAFIALLAYELMQWKKRLDQLPTEPVSKRKTEKTSPIKPTKSKKKRK